VKSKRDHRATKRAAPRSGSDSTFLLSAVLAILVFLVAYSNSLHNAFHFDDSSIIVDNVFIRDLANIPRFFTDATTSSSFPPNTQYRPLVTLTNAVDYRLGGGLSPVWFHATQLALFIATGVMLFFLYLKLFATTGAPRWYRWAALFAATLFCVHTGNTQTGNWIHTRTELLSGLGVLGGFMVYIYRPAWRRYYLYLLPVVIGSLAKTPTVMFAPLLLVYMLLIEQQLSLDDVFSKRAWPQVRGALLTSAPAFILAAILYKFIEGMNGPAQVYSNIARMPYFITQTWVWVRYLRMFFVPTGLSADTDQPLITTWADARVIAGLLLLVVLLVAAWRSSRTRERRPIAFGIAWFWLALLPASSIFPLSELTNDHRVFFPFMGLTAAVVWWACLVIAETPRSRAARRRLPVIVTAAALIVLGAHAIATYRRNRVWLTGETLWQDVATKSPRNGRGLMNYGLTQMRVGRYQEAKDLFMRAYEFAPNYSILHVNIAIVTNAMGDSVGAEQWFKRALATDPGYPDGHQFYAGWLVGHGRAPEAITHLEKAVELSAANISSRQSLLELYAARGDTAALRSAVRGMLELSANDSSALEYSRGLTGNPGGTAAEWFARGLGKTAQNSHAQAAYAYRMAVTLDPTNADAWNSLGWSLGKLGFFAEAEPALERALGLRPDFTLAKNNLAWVKGALPAK
jgi:Flp pilus assembly protein TadD